MNKIILPLLSLCSILVLFSCTKDKLKDGSFVDNRDGQTYKTIAICDQIWMAENMRYDVPNQWCDTLLYNGHIASSYFIDTVHPDEPAFYGRYYDYYTALTICPSGWHLPSIGEWETMRKNVGNNSFLHDVKSSYDWYDNKDGSNRSGLNLFPAGLFNSYFFNIGKAAFFWTSSLSEEQPSLAISFGITNYNQVLINTSANFSGYSCRCVKD